MSEKANEPKKGETFAIPLVDCCCSFREILEDAARLYQKTMQNFMSSSLTDKDLPEKAAVWAKASQQLIESAGAQFHKYPANAEEQQESLKIISACKKDSYMREKNLYLHLELTEQKMEEDPENFDKKEHEKCLNAVLDAIHFCNRAENTHIAWVRRFMNGEFYEPVEMQLERQWGSRVRAIKALVPWGHAFYPARLFPPKRVPAGQRVPYPPEVYGEWKKLPLEAFRFDEEHDEFVLRDGYVSPDGRIDDQSVVFNWEDHTVSMKFVGEEPVVWPFWKAKDSADIPDWSGWCAEYSKRAHDQMIADEYVKRGLDP